MKRICNSLLGVLAAMACIVIFTQCKGEVETNKATVVDKQLVAQGLKIAYVDVDTLLTQYSFCVDLNEAMLKKEENIRLTLNQKATKLDNEQKEFQNKYQNNAFISQDRAQQEYNRLLKMQQDLQELTNKLTTELANENAKNNLQLRDSINNFIKQYNQDKGYHMILSNTGFDNLLYADPAFNITREIVEGLNARYISKK